MTQSIFKFGFGLNGREADLGSQLWLGLGERILSIQVHNFPSLNSIFWMILEKPINLFSVNYTIYQSTQRKVKRQS